MKRFVVLMGTDNSRNLRVRKFCQREETHGIEVIENSEASNVVIRAKAHAKFGGCDDPNIPVAVIFEDSGPVTWAHPDPTIEKMKNGCAIKAGRVASFAVT